MCFKNLPIEFDAAGNATLKPGVANPYSYTETAVPTPIEDDPARMQELVARNGAIRRVDFDPVTRVAGALAFHTVVDLENRQVMETASMATLFRGYEIILQGRDPRDAIFISSRACGVCGGVHATCSALCLEMAFGIQPPPMGVVARNLLLSIEYLYDHPIHLGLLAGPDFSEPAVRETNPEIWERAQSTRAPGRALHGYEYMSELMTDLTPLTGKLYLEGLHYTRVAREAYVLIGGKYPHPQTVVPGGVSTHIGTTELNEMMLRVVQYFDYGRKVVAVWDDLADFFYEVNPKYRDVGTRPKNMIEPGQWDDPYVYDGTFENADEWGRKRWAPPGVIVDGELVTTSLQMMNAGVEEFVEHAFYEEWTGNGDGQRFATDPAGNPLSPYHPWNKRTIPKPTATNWKEKYSWATAPRWDRQAMETGAYSRIWAAAQTGGAAFRDSKFLHSTGHSMQIELPRAELPNDPIEWRIPDTWGAFERNRARAYCILYTAAIAYDNLLLAYDLVRRGGPDARMSTPYKVPKDHRMGAGLWGAGRGYLTHHMEMDDGVIQNYQILTPSTWMASPKDPFGNPGPYEEAVMATPLLENYEKPEDFKGIDVLRAIRSFDPCMPCTTHLHMDDRTITREIISCACGAEGPHEH
ncbi:MAG TPA: nickel-dependent hydrogenase large subunit [Solirubrobacteraceae bacterium]|nr:nickel-dependent hydrogenase large subunit [Solirubrobacteraceae bacterium]